MDYKALAKSILHDIGGEENVVSFTHCATRLRFNLKDDNKVDKKHLDATKGVMGVVNKGGQFQVVIGSDVPNVYRELNMMGSFGGTEGEKTKRTTGTFLSEFETPLRAFFRPLPPPLPVRVF